MTVLEINDNNFWFPLGRKGYGDTEIEAMFAKYDTDGDRILDPEEQRHLAEDLLKQKDSLNQEYAKITQDAKEGETPSSLADLIVRWVYVCCISVCLFFVAYNTALCGWLSLKRNLCHRLDI